VEGAPAADAAPVEGAPTSPGSKRKSAFIEALDAEAGPSDAKIPKLEEENAESEAAPPAGDADATQLDAAAA
jgi:hypothetical protein